MSKKYVIYKVCCLLTVVWSCIVPLLHAESPAVISKNEVRIGLLLDLAGPYADLNAASETAARMAVEDFGGRVLGAPIEVIVLDHQNKPDIAASLARELFDVRKVDALMEVTGSATALAVMEVAREKDKIVILNGAASSRITNEGCTRTSVHYAFDTYALAYVIGSAVTRHGGDSWFFITADYTFGHDLERETTQVVKANGGRVLGHAPHPLNNGDFSAQFLQATSSSAKVIGLANAGADTINAIKQAAEFHVQQGGQQIAALLTTITEVNAMGLDVAQGMLVTEAFYWDMNDETRAFAKRFYARAHRMPNLLNAGVYSATMHYLEAVQAAGSDATTPVMRNMRELPIDDFFAHGGRIREDGRMVHDMYLFQVKAPEESKEPWDDYTLVATIPGDQAFQPLSTSRCPLIAH